MDLSDQAGECWAGSRAHTKQLGARRMGCGDTLHGNLHALADFDLYY